VIRPLAEDDRRDLGAAQVDGLVHPHAVPIHHEDEEVIAHAVSACLTHSQNAKIPKTDLPGQPPDLVDRFTTGA
jgi:hypothetical protein